MSLVAWMQSVTASLPLSEHLPPPLFLPLWLPHALPLLPLLRHSSPERSFSLSCQPSPYTSFPVPSPLEGPDWPAGHCKWCPRAAGSSQPETVSPQAASAQEGSGALTREGPQSSWCIFKDRHVGQWDRAELSEPDPCVTMGT